jgi:hypothetical protein
VHCSKTVSLRTADILSVFLVCGLYLTIQEYSEFVYKHMLAYNVPTQYIVDTDDVPWLSSV